MPRIGPRRTPGVFGLAIEVDGHVQTLAFFEGLDRELKNFKPIFKEAEKKLRKFFVRQFAGQGIGPREGKWKQLSDNPSGKGYRSRKRRARPGRKILVWDGTLRRALTRRSDPHGLRVITRDQFAFGTKGLDYASHHQYGSKDGRRPPRRMIIDLDRRFRLDLQKALRWHVRKVAIRQRRLTGAPVGIRTWSASV